MSAVIETEQGFMIAGPAMVVADDIELAWAQRSVRTNPNHKFILGKYVEADRANSNRQMWQLDDLRAHLGSVINSPLNMVHNQKRVVGHYVDVELLYPTLEDAAEHPHPYADALSVFYRNLFPREYEVVENAHASGTLFYSMECRPESIKCVGEGSCGAEFAYDGPNSPTYCSEVNERKSDRLLQHPHFMGGALIVPPVQPGWKSAEIHSLVAQYADVAETLYDQLAVEAPHLEPKQWEQMMFELLDVAAKRKVV